MDVNSFVIGYTKGKQSASGGGGGSGGGAELNIAYGDTPPEDTTKLWVKTGEPSGVLVSTNPDYETIPAHTVTELSATLLTANWRMDAAVVGEKIYIFGGNRGTETGTKKIQCFDTLTKTLGVLPVDMPYVMNNMCCATYGNKIYLFGGNIEEGDVNTVQATDTIMRFDPNTQAFEILDVVLPEARLGSCASCVGSKIYIFGGYNDTSSTKTIYCFDCETNTVTTLDTVLPLDINRGASCVIGTKIYVVYISGSEVYVYCFDTETETVLTLDIKNPTYMISKGDACVAAVGDYLYMYATYGTSVIRYDPSTQTAISVEHLPTDRIDVNKYFKFKQDMVCGLVDGKVYVFGGKWDEYVGQTPHFSYKIYCHNPMGGKDYLVEENDLLIIPRMESYTFPIINAESAKIEIGVDSVYKGNEEGKGEEVKAALYKDGAWTTI